MTHTQVMDKINELGYKGFKEAYERQSEDVIYSTMSFEERLFQLLDAQDLFLRNKRIHMNHRLSKIKDKQAALDAIDYRSDRNLNKVQVKTLAQLNFISAKQNVIITGKTGCGKSFLSQALANHAIHHSYRVYYIESSHP